MTVALTRVAFRPSELDAMDMELIDRAASLGYRPQIAAQHKSQMFDENALATALDKIGLKPFSKDSVEAYKALMLQTVLRRRSWALTRYMHRSSHNSRYESGAGERVVVALGLPSFISAGICSMIAGVLPSVLTATHGLLLGLPGLALAMWAFLMILRHKKALNVKASWQLQDLASYNKPIPHFALSHMLEIHQELPTARFYVEELQATEEQINTEKRQPLPPDPFLVVEYGSVRAYVDVWDEPRFEGRATV
jgi:hypothetical protein